MKDNRLDNDVFVDEISADSIIVNKKKSSKKIIFVVIFFILLSILLVYMLFRLGFISLNSKQYISGNLFVVHSNVNFGDEIISFNNYDSYDRAFSYTFHVVNNNNNEYMYEVKLRPINYEKSSSIFYAIIKDEVVLFKGEIDSSDSIVLTTQNILPDKTDNYELRLWSNDVNEKLQFKIDVEK